MVNKNSISDQIGDNDYKKLRKIWDVLTESPTSYEHALIIINAMVFTLWKQMGARPEFVNEIIKSVAEPFKEAAVEFLKQHNYRS